MQVRAMLFNAGLELNGQEIALSRGVDHAYKGLMKQEKTYQVKVL